MPTRKIAELQDSLHQPPVCKHIDHDPPNPAHLQPGIYEHFCPGCGTTTEFTAGAPEDHPVLSRR